MIFIKKRKITKAIIAAAGNATRFLPASKNLPKQMFPIIDQPIIQYLVEEAVDSGIKDIIIVTQAGQNAMEDYFDNNIGLEHALESKGKIEHLKRIREVTKMANFVYVRQKKHLPYGNGTPLLVAQNLIDDDESFVYMFGDDVTLSNTSEPITKQLMNVFNAELPSAILAVQQVSDSEVSKLATVKYKENANYKYEIEDIVEKAPLGENPSNMAQFGRFIFTNDFLTELKHTKLGIGNELWVADVVKGLANKGKKVIAQPIDGIWLTTGDPLNYLNATIEFALKREDMSLEVKNIIKNAYEKYIK